MAKVNNTKADIGNPEKIRSYREAYPQEKTFYMTSDGQVFLGKNKKDAEAHQKHIDKENTIATISVD